MFPSVPARELSSISSWRESKASRKLNFVDLWPTSLSSQSAPILATCWARCPPWPPCLLSLSLFLFLPCSKTKHINETIFPIMFVNEVSVSLHFGLRRTCSHERKKHKLIIVSLDYRRRLSTMIRHPRWGRCSWSWLLRQTSLCSSWAWVSSCCSCSSSCSAETARRR